MNYRLQNKDDKDPKTERSASLAGFLPFIREEKALLLIAFLAILLNSGLNLIAPNIIGKAVDKYIIGHNFHGLLISAAILFVIYLWALLAGYVQTRVMGGVAQRVLFRLRNTIFSKLQQLPVAFFAQNKAGDLISRINNDTDKLNQFFSQGIMQFVGNVFVVIGAGIFVLALNVRLGAAALAPAVALLIITQLLSSWIKKKNAGSLQSTGSLSASIQESLENFNVIVTFNRRDYFRDRLHKASQENYTASVHAGVANMAFVPFYAACASVAQLIVLVYGVMLITSGHITIGLLISYLTYVTRFYDPLRQMASIWASFQLAMASWDRISKILSLPIEMETVPALPTTKTALFTFQNVQFSYPDGKEVLHNINFSLEKGKTYALVGPTGGGKTTTASLMARLYDPTSGEVLLEGRDIRSYSEAERTKKIGFILQEPFLFAGTVKDNILYGNEEYQAFSSEQLTEELEKAGFQELLARFEKGVETAVLPGTGALSLGQRQLVAFMRAALRKPALLILDEATANIDTVTEQLLQRILEKLPKETTRVIIAHRLNTIENADEIFFVNSGEIVLAGSLDHAVDMLLHGKRQS